MKLEKLEFSGIKGQVLSDRVLAMFNEFSELMTAMVGKPYDCLDPDSQVREGSEWAPGGGMTQLHCGRS